MDNSKTLRGIRDKKAAITNADKKTEREIQKILRQSEGKTVFRTKGEHRHYVFQTLTKQGLEKNKAEGHDMSRANIRRQIRLVVTKNRKTTVNQIDQVCGSRRQRRAEARTYGDLFVPVYNGTAPYRMENLS